MKKDNGTFTVASAGLKTSLLCDEVSPHFNNPKNKTIDDLTTVGFLLTASQARSLATQIAVLSESDPEYIQITGTRPPRKDGKHYLRVLGKRRKKKD